MTEKPDKPTMHSTMYRCKDRFLVYLNLLSIGSLPCGPLSNAQYLMYYLCICWISIFLVLSFSLLHYFKMFIRLPRWYSGKESSC